MDASGRLTITEAAAKVAVLEAAKRAAEEAARPRLTDAERYLLAIGSFFDPENADIWAEMTDDERRKYWAMWEYWRLLSRLKELGRLEGVIGWFARWDHEKLDAYVEKYGAEGEDVPEPEEGPISCEMLGRLKHSVRCTIHDFTEFGVRHVRQIDHLHFYGRTEETTKEANIRLAEAGSLPPDPLPHYP